MPKVAVFCFGRMNPPTLGHKLLMETTVRQDGDPFIFLSKAQNATTDPLSFDIKVAFVKQLYPEYAPHIVDSHVKNPLQAANWIYNKGYREFVFVAGADRLGHGAGSLRTLLTNWNREDIRLKDGRDEVKIRFVSCGHRDPDSDSISGFSASKARSAASQGNAALFQHLTGVSESIKVMNKTLYQAVCEGLGLQDDIKGGIAGGIIGAALTKSPSGAVAGYNVGSDIEDFVKSNFSEAAYNGNIGIMELIQFFTTVGETHPEIVELVKKLVSQGKTKEVWDIVQRYTGTVLQGKEFS